MPESSSIIICGRRYDVGQRVVTFEDNPAFNAYTLHRTDDPRQIYPFAPAKGLGAMAARYRPRRLIGADRSVERLRQVLKQFVVHHDGCPDSKTCFQVLHNERGLSVHFLIDNDGTIFQTLDVVDCAFQAAGVNEISVGVELANRGDAQRFPNEYRGQRDKVTCTIHGHQFLAYSYTQAQMESLISLGKCMARVFPNLPQTYPMGGDLEPMWSALGDPRQYSGYLGHYHVTDQKWDPGPFDFKYFSSKIRSRVFFPVVLSGSRADLPDDEYKVEDIANEFYENNETEGEGGYYPVGPYGQSKLWHGGIHIRADRGMPLYAPFAGKVVAARMTDECAVGSRNFVLLRHDLTVGQNAVRFWTLFFHIDEESAGRDAPAWWTRSSSQLTDEAVGLNIDVAAGELVGHVGEAGPPGRFEGQVHVEIMSAEEIGSKLQPGFWTAIDGSSWGRFCEAPEIVDRIDRAGGVKDGALSRAEMMTFFRSNPDREAFRKLTVRHLSEWADNHDWEVALSKAKDFADLPRAQRSRLFHDQIEPVLWWNDEVQDAADLPTDKMVWNYHPITFIIWMKERLKQSQVASKGIGNSAEFGGKAAPKSIKDDAEATEGFTDDEDLLYGEAGKKLELEDLIKGYPDDK